MLALLKVDGPLNPNLCRTFALLVDPQIVMYFLLLLNCASVSAFWMRGCEDPVVRAKRVSCRGEPSNCQERLYQNSVKTEKECEQKVNIMSTGSLALLSTFHYL